MKYIKAYEKKLNDGPLLGEYLIYTYFNVVLYYLLVKVSSGCLNIIDTQGEHETYILRVNSIIRYTKSVIYYDFDDYYFYSPAGKKCNILWRGMNEEDAYDEYETLLNIHKYNL